MNFDNWIPKSTENNSVHRSDAQPLAIQFNLIMVFCAKASSCLGGKFLKGFDRAKYYRSLNKSSELKREYFTWKNLPFENFSNNRFGSQLYSIILIVEIRFFDSSLSISKQTDATIFKNYDWSVLKKISFNYFWSVAFRFIRASIFGEFFCNLGLGRIFFFFRKSGINDDAGWLKLDFLITQRERDYTYKKRDQNFCHSRG